MLFDPPSDTPLREVDAMSQVEAAASHCPGYADFVYQSEDRRYVYEHFG
ncbi:MAG: hypothetical protein ACLP9L_26785 [Thermoguttaceae bacterium]